jgi:hypothetical protein
VQRSEALRLTAKRDSIEALDFTAELFDRETHRALDVVAGAAPKLRHINSTVCYAVGLFACQTRRFGDNDSNCDPFFIRPLHTPYKGTKQGGTLCLLTDGGLFLVVRISLRS